MADRKRPSAAERYWMKVDTTAGAEGCWPWTACRNYRGYGLFYGEKMGVATRWGWRLLNGEIPDGYQVCHTCDNPPCMNPAHWFLGTCADNMADKVAKGRQARGDRNGARLRPERLARGLRNGTHTHPERVPSGDSHYARTNPERLPRGESHGQAKLNSERVRELRARHAAGVLTNVLATEYGVAHTTIRRIVARKIWAHVD